MQSLSFYTGTPDRPFMRQAMEENRRPLRILQINAGDVGGGIGSGGDWVVWNLLNEYRRRGHRSWLGVRWKRSDDPDVFLVPHGVASNPWSQAFNRLGDALLPLAGKMRGVGILREALHEIGHPGRRLSKWQGIEDFDFPGTWSISKLVPESPDVIHCHSIQHDFFDLRVLPWLSHQLPVFLTLHDAWYLSGYCYNSYSFSHSLDCDRWKTGCGRCPDLSIPPGIRRDSTAYNWERKRNIYRRSLLHVATPSRWLMRKVEQSILMEGAVDLRVIPNGVDLSIFRPNGREAARRQLGLPSDRRILLFMAHHIWQNPSKDFGTMRAAVTKVAARLKGQRIMFVVLGDAAPPARAGEDEVLFVPLQSDRPTVARYYQASDVYLHAALVENFPNTVMEAMACGTPVVATATGGIPEQVTDGHTGSLVPPGDAEAMADAVEKLLVDETAWNRISTNAAEEAHRRFGLDRQVEAYLRWYAEICESWKHSAPTNKIGRAAAEHPA